MKKAFVQALCAQAAENENLVLITGDLGFGVLTPFWQQYPGRFFNAGISEQNMAAMAAGMAMEGKTVFTYSIGNFPTLRCLEQVRNDICYHNANVKIVAVGGGFGYGPMGMSHHATEDIAIMRALPGMVLLSPADCPEAIAATAAAACGSGPFYLRLGHGGEADLHQSPPGDIIGKVLPMCQGQDVAILATGPIVAEAMDAAKILAEKGLRCAVYSVPSIKPLDESGIRAICKNTQRIYTAEEHSVIGGLGGAVAELLSGMSCAPVLRRFGLEDCFASVVGSQAYLRGVYGISAAHMAAEVLGAFR